MFVRNRWVIGNWKMNGSLAANAALLEAITAAEPVRSAAAGHFAVCVPAPYFNQAQRALGGTRLQWGGQDVSEHASGAYTGQICSAMLREFGARIVLVGHSERRQYQNESSEEVAAKAAAAFDAGLTPVICVGETLIDREAGAAESTVVAQLEPCAALIQRAGAALVVAYEPVWAIGTGRTATAEQAQAMHAFIRSELASIAPNARDTSILYGGSVKTSNARELFGQADIDGGLIGGASLIASDFIAICGSL